MVLRFNKIQFRTRKDKRVYPVVGGAPLYVVTKSGLSPKERLKTLYSEPKKKALEAIDEQKRNRILKKQILDDRKERAQFELQSKKTRDEINRLIAIQNARLGVGMIGKPTKGISLVDYDEAERNRKILPSTSIPIIGGRQAIGVTGNEQKSSPNMPRRIDDKTALGSLGKSQQAPPTSVYSSTGKRVKATGLTPRQESKEIEQNYPSPRGSLPKGFDPNKTYEKIEKQTEKIEKTGDDILKKIKMEERIEKDLKKAEKQHKKAKRIGVSSEKYFETQAKLNQAIAERDVARQEKKQLEKNYEAERIDAINVNTQKMEGAEQAEQMQDQSLLFTVPIRRKGGVELE